jgi:hypothetical protein
MTRTPGRGRNGRVSIAHYTAKPYNALAQTTALPYTQAMHGVLLTPTFQSDAEALD